MLSPGFPLTDTPIFYYDTRRLRPKLHFIGLGEPAVPTVLKRRKRIWIVDHPASATRTAALGIVEPLLREYRYRATSVHFYTTSITLAVLLAIPRRRPDRSGATAPRTQPALDLGRMNRQCGRASAVGLESERKPPGETMT